MSYKRLKNLSWNCRGLGSLEKCLVVRNVIKSSRCDIICLQETKLDSLELSHVHTILPTFFDKQCGYINAIGTSGGCLIAWKRNYVAISSWATSHFISVLLLQTNYGKQFVVTNVYGPSQDEEKLMFICEIRVFSGHVSQPWILVGDFKLVRWLVDRTGDMRSFGLMSAFNDLISELKLIDVPLKNR